MWTVWVGMRWDFHGEKGILQYKGISTQQSKFRKQPPEASRKQVENYDEVLKEYLRTDIIVEVPMSQWDEGHYWLHRTNVNRVALPT